MNALPDIADKRPKIVLVEDEAILRSEIAFQLKHLGLEVATFPSAEAFYRYAAVNPIAIAILDIGLGGEDGLSVCSHLREHDSRMGIILYTARDQAEDQQAGRAAGADAYLIKPVNTHELATTIRQLLTRLTTQEPTDHTPAGNRSGDNDWRLCRERMALLCPNGDSVALTVSEIRLLNCLMEQGDNVCPIEALTLSLELPTTDASDRHRIENSLSRLRAKVQRESGLKLPISAIRNRGYQWG